MIATDDRHRIRWPYTFARKGMASELLNQLISMLQTHYGTRVYIIQMNSSFEHYGKSAKHVETTHGVKIIKTAPYTPEFNGVAQWPNRIIFDKVRATIGPEQVPMELCRLVLEDKVRKTNITTTRAVDGLTSLSRAFSMRSSHGKILGLTSLENESVAHKSRLICRKNGD